MGLYRVRVPVIRTRLPASTAASAPAFHDAKRVPTQGLTCRTPLYLRPGKDLGGADAVPDDVLRTPRGAVSGGGWAMAWGAG